MSQSFRFYAFVLTVAALSGCASQGKPPPSISLDEPVQAQELPEPLAPVEVVAVPEPLALPAQLKPLPEVDTSPAAPEPTDEKVRVSRANAEARIAPVARGWWGVALAAFDAHCGLIANAISCGARLRLVLCRVRLPRWSSSRLTPWQGPSRRQEGPPAAWCLGSSSPAWARAASRRGERLRRFHR